MISVEFNINPDGVFSLSVRGHAGSAEYGRDLVCSAVSTLFTTLAQAVQEMYMAGKLKEAPDTVLEQGEGDVTCNPKKYYYEEARCVFNTIVTGMRLVAYNNSQYVEVKTLYGG